MSRALILVNLLFVTFIIGAGMYIVRELRASQPRDDVARRTPTSPAAPPRAAAGAPTTENYGVVATRTLFNPGRSDRAVAPVAAGPAVPPLARPSLHGIILRDGAPVAYLEDPATKRVAGYRLGDTIIGGSVQTIAADHVIIARPDGNVDVRLHDPSRPRPASTPASGGASSPPGGPSVPGGMPTPPFGPGPPAGGGPSVTPPVPTPPTSLAPGSPPSPPTRRVAPADLPRSSRDD
jgi:hypothetical protein